MCIRDRLRVGHIDVTKDTGCCDLRHNKISLNGLARNLCNLRRSFGLLPSDWFPLRALFGCQVVPCKLDAPMVKAVPEVDGVVFCVVDLDIPINLSGGDSQVLRKGWNRNADEEKESGLHVWTAAVSYAFGGSRRGSTTLPGTC